jgi:hypothetical protein
MSNTISLSVLPEQETDMRLVSDIPQRYKHIRKLNYTKREFLLKYKIVNVNVLENVCATI